MRLDASGTLGIDSVGLNLIGFKLDTPLGTDLAFNAMMGMGDMTKDPATPLSLNLDGVVSTSDARLMFPASSRILQHFPTRRSIRHGRYLGHFGQLNIADLSLAVNSTIRLRAKGNVENAFDPARIGGDLSLDGALIDLNRFKPLIFTKETAKQFNFPMTNIKGLCTHTSG